MDPILNLDPRYMARIDAQYDYAENMINAHRGAITDALLQIAALKAMLPLASKEAGVNEKGQKTSEFLQYKQELTNKQQEVKLRQAAIDALLPEYERLKALKDAADAEKPEEPAADPAPAE